MRNVDYGRTQLRDQAKRAAALRYVKLLARRFCASPWGAALVHLSTLPRWGFGVPFGYDDIEGVIDPG